MDGKTLLGIMRPGTQNYKVLEWLLYYGHITVTDMHARLHINSPRDCIYKLRGYGLPIVSTHAKTTSGKNYIIYELRE